MPGLESRSSSALRLMWWASAAFSWFWSSMSSVTPDSIHTIEDANHHGWDAGFRQPYQQSSCLPKSMPRLPVRSEVACHYLRTHAWQSSQHCCSPPQSWVKLAVTLQPVLNTQLMCRAELCCEIPLSLKTCLTCVPPKLPNDPELAIRLSSVFLGDCPVCSKKSGPIIFMTKTTRL